MAKEKARIGEPLKTAIWRPPLEHQMCKSVSFENALQKVEESENSDAKPTASLPEHWMDKFHEPDGTHPSLIVGQEDVSAEEYMREDVMSERKNGRYEGEDSMHVNADSCKHSAREWATSYYFRRGDNMGAKLLERHLAALVTLVGKTECTDDVSGEVLDEDGVRAARKLEMEYFQQKKCVLVCHS